MSHLEEALLAQIAEARLPAPKTEFRFAPPRRWKFDLSWDIYRLAVEVEGGIWTFGRHTRGKGYEADCEKYAEATLQGWRVLRVTGAMVKDGRALVLIRRGLTRNPGGGLEHVPIYRQVCGRLPGLPLPEDMPKLDK